MGTHWVMMKSEHQPRPIDRFVPDVIRMHYGTERGLVRLALAQLEHYSGRLEPFKSVIWPDVRRLVFVCRGNVCRSAYAESAARARNMVTASFGISATTGALADDTAICVARHHGVDLTCHRATDFRDFELRDGDLLLPMEVRQARWLRRSISATSVQVSLLGLWSAPRRPHIHDPYRLDPRYFQTVFRVIDTALAWLKTRYPGIQQG